MSGAVWINGAFVERSDARVSAFDAGLQHAVGLFETMFAYEGRVFRLFDHLDRLNRSARELGLTDNLKLNPLGEAVNHVVAESGLDRARVRLTVTGGDLNLLSAGGPAPVDPTIMIAAQPATPYPAEMFERGVMAVIGSMRLNPLDPLQGHKTLSYWGRLRELQTAARAGAGEALLLQVTNHLGGGAVSNVFLLKDGALLTPIARGEEDPGPSALRSPVLPGVTRRAILDFAGEMGLTCEARMLSVEDLLGADEAFLTNSSWGVLPLVRVEAAPVGSGAPGPLTHTLRAKWMEAVAEEGGEPL